MMKPQLTPKDWQLLSEYLDGQLSERDQAKLEQRLKKQAELHTALEDMRQMRSVLRAVPRHKVPHNFTLTHAMVAEQQQTSRFLRWIPALSLSSALATLILVVTLLLGGAPAMTGGPQVAQAPPQEFAMAQKSADLTAQQTEGPIILWNGQYGAATGLGGGGGGGGGGEVDGRGGGPGLGGGGEAPQQAVPQQPPSMLQEEQTPANKGIPPAPEGTPLPNDTLEAPAAGLMAMPTQTPEGEAAPQALAQAPSAEAAPIEGSGPILGVAPKDEQGKITTVTPSRILTQPEQVEKLPPPNGVRRFTGLLAAQIGLVLIAIAAGLGAILLRIRSRS